MKEQRIILAPVSEKSFNNYTKQMANADKGQPVLWSGEVNVHDETGDYFGFVHHTKDIIEISLVQFVLPCSVRSTDWVNYDDLTRNTLVISPRFMQMSYSNFKRDGGYKSNLVLNTNKRLYWPYQFSIV
jgi:hypothetical protein